MFFWIVHIVSKFQIFIHIFTVAKPKNKNQNFKNGEKHVLYIILLILVRAIEIQL